MIIAVGRVKPAFRLTQQALAQAQALHQPQAMASAAVCAATVQFRLGHYAVAQALADQALALAASDTPERADALLMQGMCAVETSDLAAGEDFFRQLLLPLITKQP